MLFLNPVMKDTTLNRRLCKKHNAGAAAAAAAALMLDRPHVLGVRTTATYFSSWLAAATCTSLATPHLFLIK
jgi:hypothetical protein